MAIPYLSPATIWGVTTSPGSGLSEDRGMGSARMLEDLLATPMTETGIQPKHPKWARARGVIGDVLGGLGDAMLAAAQAKAGGVPGGIGPYAQFVEARRIRAGEFQRKAEESRRLLREKVALQTMEGEQKETVEKIRAMTQLEESRIKARAQVDKAIVQAQADELKRTQDAVSGIRKGLIDAILERNIDTTGVDLLTAEPNELKQILDRSDPGASVAAIMSNLPGDMTLDQFRVNKDGTMSFDIKRADDVGADVPVGVIRPFIESGVDASSFVKDPEQKAAVREAAYYNRKKILRREANDVISNLWRVAKSSQVKADGYTPDYVNQSLAGVIPRIQLMSKDPNITKGDVLDLWNSEADRVAVLSDPESEDSTWTEAEANSYLGQLEQMIRLLFEVDVLSEEAAANARDRSAFGPPGGMPKERTTTATRSGT